MKVSEIKTLEDCNRIYKDVIIEELHCNASWDKVLCWPPTKAGETAKQPCPPYKGVDLTKFVYKRCSEDGWWEDRKSGEPRNPQGWTNYSPCFTPEIKRLIDMLYIDSEEDAVMKIQVAQRTRILEMVGLGISLASLTLSLFIFFYYRSLKNHRTIIHRHLFVAILIQVLIRLTLYIDQYITRYEVQRQGIDNTPTLCEAFYIFLEYARTAMFMWMFIEGLYLHSVLTISTFKWQLNRKMYLVLGWGVPLIMTMIWASVTAIFFMGTQCWWGYNLSVYFWILEGPRLTVIVTNLLFLLNIIRVLVTKMKESNSSEAQQVRKAVKAAIVLLPLLGITNFLGMVHSPVHRKALEFALWSYFTNFLTSFQGFFIAFIYCFLNGEVRTAVAKAWHDRQLRRSIDVNRPSCST